MYLDFEKWVDSVLKEHMPLLGVAINFNLYEDADSYWSMQFLAQIALKLAYSVVQLDKVTGYNELITKDISKMEVL